MELIWVNFLNNFEEFGSAWQETRLKQLRLIGCKEVLQVSHLIQILLETHIGLQLLVFKGNW